MYGLRLNYPYKAAFLEKRLNYSYKLALNYSYKQTLLEIRSDYLYKSALNHSYRKALNYSYKLFQTAICRMASLQEDFLMGYQPKQANMPTMPPRMSPRKTITPSNCYNCGAPLRSCVCEYCGTNYDDVGGESGMTRAEAVFYADNVPCLIR